MRRNLVSVAVGVVLLAAGAAAFSGSAAAASSGSSGGSVTAPQWPSGGQGLSDDHFQPDETTLGVKQASKLVPRWTLAIPGDVSATPAVVNGVVYVPDWGGYVSAIKASSGRVIWRRLVSSYNGVAGSVSRTDPVVDGSTVVIGSQLGADLIGISTATGARKWVTQVATHPDAQITGSPVSYQGVVYIGVSSTKWPDGEAEPLLGIGQKSGVYWALHPSTGYLAWDTQVGPGSPDGGALWGTASDGIRIYLGEGNSNNTPFILRGNGSEAGETCTGGAWSALSPATGHILWQTCDPAGAVDTAAVSVADGVVYAGSMARTGDNMYALNAATGAILWRFASGGSVAAGPAVVAGSVYWGSGYSKSGSGSASKRLYAFGV